MNYLYEESWISDPSTRQVVESILNGDPQMKALVDTFKTGIDNITTLNRPAIKAVVVDSGRKIWSKALANAKGNGLKPFDDRPLYWARLKMRQHIRNHSKMKNYPVVIKEMIDTLESISRGYDQINFGPTPGGVKKVLISGYDPFQLNYNIKQSNPSGAAALALHGKTILNGATPVAYVQAAIFPVRYRDFDKDQGKGIVEQFFEKFIRNNEVDMIMTISQGGPFQFWVDRFASRYRGTGKDNENETGNPFPANPAGDQFYFTKLDVSKIVPSVNPPGTLFKILYNNNFKYTSPLGDVNLEADDIEDSLPDFPDGILDVENASHPLHAFLQGHKTPNQLTELTSPKKSQIQARMGSGGDYLSNEIFYRVSLMRTKLRPALKTGHFHIPWIQAKTEWIPMLKPNKFNWSNDFRSSLTNEIVKVIEESIKKASI